MRRAAYIGLAAIALAGCAPDIVTVDMNYPSQETFLQSEFARIFVYPLSERDLGLCPTILRGTLSGAAIDQAILKTDPASVCQFQRGGVVFRDIPEGPHAWVGVVTNDASVPLLAGCTVAELYVDAPEIEINLFMTQMYRTTVPENPRCTSIADKCERGCP